VDWRTWRDILDSWYAQAVKAAADRQAALNGDPVALISVLDYIVSQISPAGGVFDMMQTPKPGEHLGLSWYDDITRAFSQSAYFDELGSHFIGTGHAWDKHGHKYAGILSTQDEFVDLIEDIIRNPDDVKVFRTDIEKRAFWDRATETVVIFDPANPDLGTAFRPDISRYNPRRTYFDQLGD
jgi:hypothetical protein